MSEPSLYGGSAGLMAVGLAAVGWLVKMSIEQAFRYCSWRKKRKEALIYFFVEVLANKRNASTICSKEEKYSLLRKIETNSKFRPYVESYEVQSSPENITDYLASLSEYEIALVSSYIEHSGLYQNYYTKLGSDEFVELPPSRKKNVAKVLFDLATNLDLLCEKLIYTLKKRHSFLTYVEEQHHRLNKDLETAKTKQSEEGDQPSS